MCQFGFLDKIINIIGDFNGGLGNNGYLQTRQKSVTDQLITNLGLFFGVGTMQMCIMLSMIQ